MIRGETMSNLIVFFEQLQYESRPVFYAGLSIYSFLYRETAPILFGCGVILALASIYICHMRYNYRHRFFKR
jgi:hypothetical protein